MAEPSTRRPIITGPELLVLHEKHGHVYYLVRDEAELNRTALHILRERDGQGWYPEPELADWVGRETVETIERYEAAAEQVVSWPDWLQEQERAKYEIAKSFADRRELDFRYRLRSWRKFREMLAQPEAEALARTNRYGTPLAWILFQHLNSGEYGGYELERFETVEAT